MIKGYSNVRYVPAFLLLDLCEEFLQNRKPEMWPGELYPWPQHPDDAPLKEDEWTKELFKVVHDVDLNVRQMRYASLNSLKRMSPNFDWIHLTPHGNIVMWYKAYSFGGDNIAQVVQQEAYHSPYRYVEEERLLQFEEGVERPVWSRAQHAQHILHLYNQLHRALHQFVTPHYSYANLHHTHYGRQYLHALPFLEEGPLADIMGFPLLLDPVVQDGIVWDTFRIKDGWHRLTAYLLYNPLASVRVALRDDTLPWILEALDELHIFVNPSAARADTPLQWWWKEWEKRRLVWLTS